MRMFLHVICLVLSHELTISGGGLELHKTSPNETKSEVLQRRDLRQNTEPDGNVKSENSSVEDVEKSLAKKRETGEENKNTKREETETYSMEDRAQSLERVKRDNVKDTGRHKKEVDSGHSTDVEETIHAESAKVRGEELEQADKLRPVPNKEGNVDAGKKKISKEEEDAKAAKGKQVSSKKQAEAAEKEESNAEVEKMMHDQTAKERAEELEDVEKIEEKHPEEVGEFSKDKEKNGKETGKENPGKSKSEMKYSKGERGRNEQDIDQDASQIEDLQHEVEERDKREELLGSAFATQKIKTDKGKQEKKIPPSESIASTAQKDLELPGEEKAAANQTRPTLNESSAVVSEQTIAQESRSVYDCILKDLPEELRHKIQETDDAEKRVLASYVTSESVPFNIVHGYTSSREAERAFLKELLPELGSEAGTVLTAYRALRKGETWNYRRLDEKFKAFFAKSSKALAEYEILKAEEKNTLDSFLYSSNSQYSSNSRNSTNSLNSSRSLNSPVSSLKSSNQVRTSNGTQRSFAELDKAEEVLQRGISATGVKSSVHSDATGRGKGGRRTTRRADEILEAGLDRTLAEEVTAKATGVRTIREEGSRMKIVIVSALIVELIVAFVIVIACRKQVSTWRLRSRRNQMGSDKEPLHEYSHLTDTDPTVKPPHFSVSVTTVKGSRTAVPRP